MRTTDLFTHLKKKRISNCLKQQNLWIPEIYSRDRAIRPSEPTVTLHTDIKQQKEPQRGEMWMICLMIFNDFTSTEKDFLTSITTLFPFRVDH